MANYRGGPLLIPLIPIIPGLLAVLLFALPVFLFGMGAVWKFFQLMWSPSVPGSIPIWAIFVIAILFIMIKKRSRY